MKLYDELEYQKLLLELVRNNNWADSVDFLVDDGLMRELNRDISPNYSTNEKIVYYYFNLCFLLEADIRYSFCSLIDKEKVNLGFKKSSNNLSCINLENNQVCCFEFDAILGNIITSLGGDVFKNSFTGRPFHVNTKALIGNSLLTFDSFDTLLDVDTKNKDINTVKVLGNYYGVSCDLNDKNIRYEWVNEVYRDVLDKYSSVLKSKFDREDFDYYLDVIRQLDLNDELSERVISYFNKINSIDCSHTVFYINVLKSPIVRVEDYERVRLTGVCSYRDEENCGLDIIMSIKQDNGSMVYFLFGDNCSLDIYSKEEIEEMFLNNQLIKIDKGYFVPGIDRSIQEESTRVAGSEIVPKVLEKVYQDSLG